MTKEKEMGIQKIFNASFEQSLNLADEDFLAVRKTWEYKQARRKEKKRKPPGKIKAVITLVMLLFLVWLIFTVVNYGYSTQENIVVKINLLPQWLCWTLMSVFLITVYGYKYGMKQNWEQMRFYNSQWMQFCYGLLFSVIFNLFFAMFLTTMIPAYIIIVILVATVVLTILIFRGYIKGIAKTLYAPEEKEATINIFIKKMLKGLFALLVISAVPYFVFKFRNRELLESIEERVIGNTPLFIAIFIGINLLMILILVYAVFPFVIQGYYRNKYAEDYRKREGQTQIEWYGEKYFNKYIKGTEKEERNDDRGYGSYKPNTLNSNRL